MHSPQWIAQLFIEFARHAMQVSAGFVLDQSRNVLARLLQIARCRERLGQVALVRVVDRIQSVARFEQGKRLAVSSCLKIEGSQPAVCVEAAGVLRERRTQSGFRGGTRRGRYSLLL